MSKFGKLIYDLQEISDYHADYNASLLDFACQPPDQHKHAEEVIDKVVNILLMIDGWANAYPPDIFIPMTKEDWADHHEILKLSKRTGSAAAADCMRYVVTQMKASVEKMS
jgi:hypothetical protein